jgi:hypothetical protein
MKAGIFFTESGPILAQTTHHFFAHPKLVEKFAEKGITKFIAYEVSIEKVEEKYGKQPRLEPDSNGDRELRIIDSDEKQIFNNFSIKDLGEPVLYEKQRHHRYKGFDEKRITTFSQKMETEPGYDICKWAKAVQADAQMYFAKQNGKNQTRHKVIGKENKTFSPLEKAS